MGCRRLETQDRFFLTGTPLQRRSRSGCYSSAPTNDMPDNHRFRAVPLIAIHNIIKLLIGVREFRIYTYYQSPELAFSVTTTYAYNTQPKQRQTTTNPEIYTYDALGRNTHNKHACPTHLRTKVIFTPSMQNLVYYNHRYYSPELGRWLSRDPIGERGGFNLYAMVGNNAVNLWDLWGLCASTTPNARSAKYCSKMNKKLKLVNKINKEAYGKRGFWFTGNSWEDIGKELAHVYGGITFSAWGDMAMKKASKLITTSMISAVAWSSDVGTDLVLDTAVDEVANNVVSDSLQQVFNLQVYPNDDCKSAIHNLASISEIHDKANKYYSKLVSVNDLFYRNCICTYYNSGEGDTLSGWRDKWKATVATMKSHQKKAEKKVIEKCTGQ